MKRTIKKSFVVNEDDYNDLSELALMFQSDTNYYYSRFSGIKSINRLNFYDLRKTLKEENPSNIRLTGHYSQRCLNAAIGNIKNMWSNTFNAVRKHLGESELTEFEREFTLVVLRSTALVSDILNTNKPFEELIKPKVFNKWKTRQRTLDDIREQVVKTWLRRMIRQCKPKIPYTKKNNRFISDSTTYRFTQNNQLTMQRPPTSSRKGRITLDIDFPRCYTSEATISLRDNQVYINFPIPIKQKASTGTSEIGLDKGFRDLLISSSEGIYGKSFGEKVKPQIEQRSMKHQERQRFWSAYRKAIEDGDLEKADRIKVNNLGYKKWNRRKHRSTELKKNLINQAINDFIENEDPKTIVVEDLTWSKSSKGKRAKKTNLQLSQWDKGYLQERLEFKAYEHNIKVVTVNPAYTSQLCHECHHFGTRDNQLFKCDHCGYSGHADVNASKNILQRQSDKEIKLFTSAKRVKEILKTRIGD